MTALVGIRCRDGVVIGADSSATFSEGGGIRTIEQPTDHKIEIVGEQVILAGTGYVGHGQRFHAVVENLFKGKQFDGKSAIEIGKLLSGAGIKDFQQTQVGKLEYAALVAYPAFGEPSLLELPGGQGGFQPEVKNVNDLWFTSAGSGQLITDPFLALLRQVFWKDGAPGIQGGIFTALWALRHACEVNSGGIKEPVRIAVLSREKTSGGKLRARMLSDDELAEHANMVAAATTHLGEFKNILEGHGATEPVPAAPKHQS